MNVTKRKFRQKTMQKMCKINSPVGIYLPNVNNRNTRTRCEICSKLAKETYVKRIWKIRLIGFFNTRKCILLMDSAKSHLGDEVEQAFTDVSSSIKIIHGEIKVSGYSHKQTI